MGTERHPARSDGEFWLTAGTAELRAECARLAAENRNMINKLVELRGFVTDEYAIWLISQAIPVPVPRS